MEMEQDIEAVMAADGRWDGTPDAMWQKVQQEIERRRQRRRWHAPAWGAAAAAVLALFIGVQTLLPSQWGAQKPPHGPVGEPVEPPPIFAPPLAQQAANARGLALFDTLPGFVRHSQVIMVGEVISEVDFAIPPTAAQWEDYRNSQTPPPPDHPKAQRWTPPPPPKPMPAKRFTFKVAEAVKGDRMRAGSMITVSQWNVTYGGGQTEPVLQVGKRYILFPRQRNEGLDTTGSPYLAVGGDDKLRVVALTPGGTERLSNSYTGGPGYLRELDGAALTDALKKLRFAVSAERAIAAALGKVVTQDREQRIIAPGMPFDLSQFPDFVGTGAGCIALTDAGSEAKIQATYDSAVWPGAGGVNEVRLTRRAQVGGQEVATTWTFMLKADGTVTGPVQSGADLSVARCR